MMTNQTVLSSMTDPVPSVGEREWRVVVADKRSPRDGRVIETIGRYNAQTEPSTVVLDEERAKLWLSRGAQPSDTVSKLLKIQGIDAPR